MLCRCLQPWSEWLLDEVRRGDQNVDELDAGKGKDDAADAVSQQVASQEHGCTLWAEADTPQRERDERRDDQRVKDDRRKDGAHRRVQSHDVEGVQLGGGGSKQ